MSKDTNSNRIESTALSYLSSLFVLIQSASSWFSQPLQQLYCRLISYSSRHHALYNQSQGCSWSSRTASCLNKSRMPINAANCVDVVSILQGMQIQIQHHYIGLQFSLQTAAVTIRALLYIEGSCIIWTVCRQCIKNDVYRRIQCANWSCGLACCNIDRMRSYVSELGWEAKHRISQIGRISIANK